MIKQTDIEARLRLFRYGLIVVVVVTFLVSLLAPYSYLSKVPTSTVAITDFLGTAILYTVVVAILMVIAYFAYSYFLKKTVPPSQ